MKTNHRRNFVAQKARDQSMWIGVKKLETKAVGAYISNDFSNGHRGMARAKRGAKKFLRNQERLEGKRMLVGWSSHDHGRWLN